MSFYTKEKIQEVIAFYSSMANWYFLKTLRLIYYYLLLTGWRNLKSYNSKAICQISDKFAELKDQPIEY